MEAPIDCEEGLVVEAPLAYFYGHLTPSDNPELYKFLLDRLASVLTRRAASNAKVRCMHIPQVHLHACKFQLDRLALC